MSEYRYQRCISIMRAEYFDAQAQAQHCFDEEAAVDYVRMSR